MLEQTVMCAEAHWTCGRRLCTAPGTLPQGWARRGKRQQNTTEGRCMLFCMFKSKSQGAYCRFLKKFRTIVWTGLFTSSGGAWGGKLHSKRLNAIDFSTWKNPLQLDILRTPFWYMLYSVSRWCSTCKRQFGCLPCLLSLFSSSFSHFSMLNPGFPQTHHVTCPSQWRRWYEVQCL